MWMTWTVAIVLTVLTTSYLLNYQWRDFWRRHFRCNCIDAGGQAAPSNVFAHFASQTRLRPLRSPIQQSPLTAAQAPQQDWQCIPPHEQPQPHNVFESLAARTLHPNSSNLTPGSALGHIPTGQGGAPMRDQTGSMRSPVHAQPQPRNVFESLAARTLPSKSHHPAASQTYGHLPTGQGGASAGYQTASMSSPALDQTQPRNVFESLAARTLHSNSSNSAANSAYDHHLATGQGGAPAREQTGSMGRPVHGITLRNDLPQYQHGHQMAQQNPAEHAGIAHDPGEASFAFAPMRSSMPMQQPEHVRVSPDTRALMAQQASAQQPEAGRPMPASFLPTRTWAAQQQRSTDQAAGMAPAYPAPAHHAWQPQQTDMMGQPGQFQDTGSPFVGNASGRDNLFGADRPDPAYSGRHPVQPQPPPAHESMAEHQVPVQVQAPPQDRPQSFYETWLQSFAASMPAGAPAWQGVPAGRIPTAAHWTAGAPPVRSPAPEMQAAASRAPAQAHPAGHKFGQQPAQQGLKTATAPISHAFKRVSNQCENLPRFRPSFRYDK